MHGEKVAFGVLVQLMLEAKPPSAVEQVLDFSSSVGLPITFADVGLGADPSQETLAQIALRSTAPGETIHNEPFEVRPQLVVEALRAANAAGEEWKRRQ
jgi:glycerol dehydrogenase